MQSIAAVNIKDGAGGETVANQKKQRFGDFIGAPHSAHRHLATHLLKEFLLLFRTHPVIHWCIDQTRRENIDTRGLQFFGKGESHCLYSAVNSRYA